MSVHPMRAQLREVIFIAAPILILSALAFWAAYQFVAPAPPTQITFSAGSPTGAYYKFAEEYARRLSVAHIKVNILESKGSLENIDRLTRKTNHVDVALLQGGTGDAKSAPAIESLGRMFTEPLWVFYKGTDEIDALAALKGKRIAIGATGSGTRKLADALLDQNQINEANTILLPISGNEGAEALQNGQADAVFLVMAPDATLVRTLLKNPDVKLMSFKHAQAYTRLFPFLTSVVLPAGVIDLVANIPAHNINLVAPEAALVVREDTHPAIVDLLVAAAQDIHGTGGMFRQIGDYPKPHDADFPMSSDAKRVYTSGAPFLRRYLPFWIATFFERMLVMVVPIATILIPLAKIVPMIYEWRIRNRINYWYAHLKQIEKALREDTTHEKTAAFRREINEIEDAVSAIPVPVHFSDRFYELRAAVDLVRQKITMHAKTSPT